jgi:hypothetical protein
MEITKPPSPMSLFNSGLLSVPSTDSPQSITPISDPRRRKLCRFCHGSKFKGLGGYEYAQPSVPLRDCTKFCEIRAHVVPRLEALGVSDHVSSLEHQYSCAITISGIAIFAFSRYDMLKLRLPSAGKL